MTDRRAEDTRPLPHRPLSGANNPDGDARVPLSERVSAAIASAGQAVPSAPPGPNDRVAPVQRPTPRRRVDADTPAEPRAAVPPPAEQTTSRRFDPAPAQSAVRRTSSGRVRRARLRLTHVDPWSVMKTAFLLSVAIGIVTVVAVAVVWGVLGVAGVWDNINKTVSDVIGGDTGDTFDIRDYLGTSRVMGFTMIVAVVDVVLITAIATLGAFLYNLSAALLGGLEVTLTEDEH